MARWISAPSTVAGVVAALIATVIAWFTLGLWSFQWEVPLEYSGDALAIAAHFKTVIDTGWYESQAALGAPFGQVYHDYPTADNLHFAVAAILGLFNSSWGVAMNVHFILGFPLAAITAVWFFRRVGVSTIFAVVLAALFSIAPYHFLRGEGHLFLSWYWVVPLAMGLAWSALRGEPLWGARAGASRGWGHLTGATGQTVLIAVLVTTASAYYAAFTLILGGVAALAAFCVARNWGRVLGAAAVGGAIVVVLLANMAPDILYRLQNGANPGALQRTPVESELYALKLTQLLLPPSYHRFEPFRFLREQYDTYYPLPSEGASLGLVGAVGFVVLVIAVFLVLAHTASGRFLPKDSVVARLAPLGFLSLLAFLFSTVGGLSTLISFVSTSLRAWNRMSIVISILALAGLGLTLDALMTRITRAGRLAARPTVAVVVAGVAVLGFGIWDQTPPIVAGARAITVTAYESDSAFVAILEEKVEPGSMIFQLPFIDFPESPPLNGVLDTDQLRPFLHSTTLRFSGAGIRGRTAIDGLRDVAELDPATFVDRASSLGYAGVIVDLMAFPNNSPLGALEKSSGSDLFLSSDGRFAFLEFAPPAE